TQIQSSRGGAGWVPFVSTATSKPSACNASTRGSSSWSNGSPPVQTTKRLPDVSPLGQCSAIARARASGESNFPPPSPPVPTKSVSQNEQTACFRSFSTPDQRLHPANRQKTAGRPAWAPSP